MSQPARGQTRLRRQGQRAAPGAPGSIARRVVESAAMVVFASAALYLVGSTYTDAYYTRMSLDAASLDLDPSYIALQAIHALPALLDYPITLVVLYLLYRLFRKPLQRVRGWYDWLHARLGRGLLLIANLIILSSLLTDALVAGYEQLTRPSNTPLGGIQQIMALIGIALLLYTVWISLGPRDSVFARFRLRDWTFIALVALVYVLGSLDSTATAAEAAAELEMTGGSSDAIGARVTLRDNTALSNHDLIFLTMRNGAYFFVERQPPLAPAAQPVAYIVPVDAVNRLQLQRINEADIQMFSLDFNDFSATPAP